MRQKHLMSKSPIFDKQVQNTLPKIKPCLFSHPKFKVFKNLWDLILTQKGGTGSSAWVELTHRIRSSCVVYLNKQPCWHNDCSYQWLFHGRGQTRFQFLWQRFLHKIVESQNWARHILVSVSIRFLIRHWHVQKGWSWGWPKGILQSRPDLFLVVFQTHVVNLKILIKIDLIVHWFRT